MATRNRTMCAGAGQPALGPRDIALNRIAGVCPECGRIGVLRKDMTLRQHSVPGTNTASHDKTMFYAFGRAL